MATLEAGDRADVSRAEAIARLNDQLRKTRSGGALIITQALESVSGFDLEVLASALADYDQFGPDNDPHGERDFGSLSLWGSNLLWKIDYYDLSLLGGSDDPADPEKTRRVLTVMLASDW